MVPFRSCLALRHLGFEDLGTFAQILARRGYAVRYLDAPLDLTDLDLTAPDLVIVLGGPIGAYEEDSYPFLTQEIALIRQRLAAGRPMLGLCLGAQLIARAAGANVYPGPAKEIGFGPVEVDPVGPLRDLAGVAMLHWHGDTFDLPAGAVSLATTPLYANQAFALGSALALQFHPEVDPDRLEAWLVGHAGELSAAGIAPSSLRAEAVRHGPSLVAAGRAMLERWLDTLS